MARLLPSLLAAGRNLQQGLVHLIYPRICWVCQQIQPLNEAPICEKCATILGHDPHVTCPRCSSTVGPFLDLSEGCSSCRDVNLVFDRTLRWGPYEGLLRDVILRMKHSRGEGLAEVVGQLWAQQIGPRLQELAPEVVIPIPLHWWRHWRRGFNQSEVLARCLAHHLRIPCRSTWLKRVRRTTQQTMQTPATRWTNMRGAFAVRVGADLAGKRVLLVDDVLTTGATANEAAKSIRPFNPKLTVVAVLAHGR